MFQTSKFGSVVTRSTTIFVVLIVASLLTSCAKVATTPRPEAKQVVITFGCDSSQVTAYQTLADQFQQIHPEINVYIRETDDIFEAWNPSRPASTLQTLASQADAFIWYNLGLDQAARLDLLLDLQPLLEENEVISSDFFPGTLNAFRYDDALWGLPAYADPLVMFYNPAVFDQLGIAYPEAGWSWEDFVALAERLTLHEDDRTGRYGFVEMSNSFPLALVYQHGGSLLRREAESALMIPFLENPQAVEALAWYGALATQRGVMPSPVERDMVGFYTLATSGGAAMWTTRLSNSGDWLVSEELPSIGVAPLPEDVLAAHPLRVWGYAVSGGTSHPQAAWSWIEYLTRQPAPPLASQRMAPVRQSLAEAESYWAQQEDAAPAIRYALTHALVEPGFLELSRVVGPVTPVLQGEMSAEEFLAEAQQRAETWQADRAAVESQPIVVATPPPKPQTPQNAITFGVQSWMQQVHHYETLAQAFMENHPDIHVEVKDVTAGHKIVDLDLMVDSADVFLWSFPTFVHSNPGSPSVLDLTPLIEADDGFSREDYVPWLLWPERGGQTSGLPVALDMQVIYYDKTVFEEAGIVHPDPDWSWDDLLTYAVQLTTGEEPDKRYGFLSYIWHGLNVYLYLESYNVHLVQQQDEETVVNFDSDAVKQAIQWWIDLDQVYGVTPPLMNAPGERDYNLLGARRVAMWTDWASNRDEAWLYEADRQLGVLPIPRGERSVAYTMLWFAYISPDTEQPEACWQWIRYLSEHLPPGHLAPVRTSLLNSPAFRQQVGAEMAVAYQKALEADAPFVLAFEDGPTPLLAWLREAWAEVAKGTDVDVALEEAQQKAQEYLEGRIP